MVESEPLLGSRDTNGALSSGHQSLPSKLQSVFHGFWPLGWVAFGGPQAHIALMVRRFVENDFRGERWLEEAQFLEIFSLCSALPGPTSTQVVTALGTLRAGVLGGILAFLLFQLPGFLALLFIGSLFQGSHADQTAQTTNAFLTAFSYVSGGLVAAAFSQVLYAAYTITKKTCATNKLRLAICVAATFFALLTPPMRAAAVFPIILVLCGLVTMVVGKGSADLHQKDAEPTPPVAISKFGGCMFLGVYAFITAIMVLLAATIGASKLPRPAGLAETMWRIGSLVFGGGQVVLPMLYAEIAQHNHWLTEKVFLSGFALVSVMPGPLFNISTFIGAAMLGPAGALLASTAIFAPGCLLVFGFLPFWDSLRRNPRLADFLAGVSVGAAGLINSAVYVFYEKSVTSSAAFAIVVLSGAATVVWSISAPYVILAGGVLGAILQVLGAST